MPSGKMFCLEKAVKTKNWVARPVYSVDDFTEKSGWEIATD
jgi:hypothetical protein